MTDASKITASHRSRRCMVYVRQSTLAQTRANTESLERQYEVAGRAVALGWSPGQVQVVDADLGLSGAQAANREGFQELVAQVALGRVGLILGLEASRLARSNSDWYQLLDLCGMTDTLIADADGIYHPGLFNDRMLLGMKGTMSEALRRHRRKASYADLLIMPTRHRGRCCGLGFHDREVGIIVRLSRNARTVSGGW